MVSPSGQFPGLSAAEKAKLCLPCRQQQQQLAELSTSYGGGGKFYPPPPTSPSPPSLSLFLSLVEGEKKLLVKTVSDTAAPTVDASELSMSPLPPPVVALLPFQKREVREEIVEENCSLCARVSLKLGIVHLCIFLVHKYLHFFGVKVAEFILVVCKRK